MIADSLLELMEQKPFPEITVTEICEGAGIGRKTFYRNFAYKEDVLDFQLDQLCEIAEQLLVGKTKAEQLYLYFLFSKQNILFFTRMNNNGLLPLCHRKFSRLLLDMMPVWSDDPVEQAYYSRYVTAGMEAIMQMWVERSFRERIDEVYAMACRIQTSQFPSVK